MTLAQRYNAKARQIMPNHPQLIVDENLTTGAQIDDVVFRRGEYLGGMAAVLIEMAVREAMEA